MVDERTGARPGGNAFLIAAAALPLLVGAFFLVASTIPNWTVPPPRYAVIVRVQREWNGGTPRQVQQEVFVREGRVEVDVRPAPPDTYGRQWALFLVEPSGNARTLSVEVPREMAKDESPRTIVVDGLAGRRVSADPVSPDGYHFENRSGGAGSGIVGDLFGMGRRGPRAALVKDRRVVPVHLANVGISAYEGVFFVGWIVSDDGPR